MTPRDDLVDLAGRYADGRIAAGELATLEAAIRDDAGFRRWFVRFLNLDAALAGQPGVAVPLLRQPDDSGAAWLASQVRRGQRSWWWRIAAMAAAALLLVLVGTWLPLPTRVPTADDVPAALVAGTQARWADPDAEFALRSGDLPRGLLRLESGSAEFRFQRGATAVLLGPVAVRFTGANALYVQSGQVLCRCPTPESRITLTTPATQVVDLGTEFAVAVAPEAGNTRVAVLEGAVRVGTATTAVLRKGESAEVRRDHVLTLLPLPAGTFDHLLASATAPVAGTGPNLLRDPGLTGTPADAWRLTDGHAELDPGAGELLIAARGDRFWPSARQAVRRSLDDGELVAASVNGVSPPGDPLQERQSAILKLVFIDEHGREFAQASRHFLLAGTAVPGQRAEVQVTTRAPPGTRAVEVQLMLNARGRSGGSVRFSRPALVIAPAATAAP
jgi:ferric-dicitrate binding protein FerR (iron transport regulator)